MIIHRPGGHPGLNEGPHQGMDKDMNFCGHQRTRVLIHRVGGLPKIRCGFCSDNSELALFDLSWRKSHVVAVNKKDLPDVQRVGLS